MLDLSPDPKSGFLFHPYEVEDHPGYRQLDASLPAMPTSPHFDTHKAKFRIVSHTGDIERFSIRHPWMKKEYPLCPGHLSLIALDGEQMECFTFGGTVQISTDDEQTTCTFTSPSPILPMRTIHDLSMWLVVEIEVLLARQEARWNPADHSDFDAHLATIDPLLFYTSCLQALHEKSLAEQKAHVRSSDEKLEHQGRLFLREEIERLKMNGGWPVQRPFLADLF